MKNTFFGQQLPVLTGVVRAETAVQAKYDIKSCVLNGAKGVDLHLSALNESEKTIDRLKDLFNCSPVPVLALHYCQRFDFSLYPLTEEQRTEELLLAVKAGANGVDMQGYTFDLPSKSGLNTEYESLPYSFLKAKPKEVVLDSKIIDKQLDFMEKVRFYKGQVLLSNHLDTFMSADAMVDFCHFIEKRKPDAIKIVTNCNTEEELAETVRSMILVRKEVETPVALFCNGKYRAISRILNPLLGGCMVFVTNGYKPYDNLGQVELSAIKTILEKAEALTFTIDGMKIYRNNSCRGDM